MAKKGQNTETKQKEASALADVGKLGAELPSWKLAGIKAMQGWAEGKQVTIEQYEKAVKAFDKRRIGSGR